VAAARRLHARGDGPYNGAVPSSRQVIVVPGLPVRRPGGV